MSEGGISTSWLFDLFDESSIIALENCIWWLDMDIPFDLEIMLSSGYNDRYCGLVPPLHSDSWISLENSQIFLLSRLSILWFNIEYLIKTLFSQFRNSPLDIRWDQWYGPNSCNAGKCMLEGLTRGLFSPGRTLLYSLVSSWSSFPENSPILIWQLYLALCYNFAGILVVRLFLGMVESIIGPGFVIVTSNWWTPAEQAFRAAFWLGGTPVSDYSLKPAVFHIRWWFS